MNSKPIHLIAFNIPWPANYGGVIDVFYQIKALHEAGADITLHCFEYGRAHANELEKYCRKVYYYKRITGISSNFSLLPYNVLSRRNPKLLTNLQKDHAPILFEGLHCCYYLNNPSLRDRVKIIRSCNVEQDYYQSLAEVESQFVKKRFFQIEAWRWKKYEPNMKGASHIAAVSVADQNHIKNAIPSVPVSFIPCFHADEHIHILPGESDYIIYHGKLSVPENEQAVLFLIRNVFSRLSCRCIIAGMDPSEKLILEARRLPNVQLIANPSDKAMEQLTTNAQIHLLVTFQPTGLKLKLLNSLFHGRHVIVNKQMLNGSGLDSACHIADTPSEMIQLCNRLINQPFTQKDIEKRNALLIPAYSNRYQAKRLLDIMYPPQEG